jgi:hypothetical protein
VVVDDLDLVGTTTSPDKADPPLAVDPDTVLAGPISFQLLKAVRWRYAQIVEFDGCVEHPELPQPYPLNIRAKALHSLSPKQPLSVAISEAFDHATP